MGKKRKFQVNESAVEKTVAVEVISGDTSNHPLCLHGPTLLFSGVKGKFYSCSMCRDKKDCSVHISADEWVKKSVKKLNEKYLDLMSNIDKNSKWKLYNEVTLQELSNRAFCLTCQELYIVRQTKKHNKGHRVISPLTDKQLTQPSTWLPALQDDSVEAQYMFTENTIDIILSGMKKNGIRNILCIGTPSIHEAASSRLDFNSVLLDYDTRFAQFHSPNKYLWYNMFNNHLFNGDEDRIILNKILEEGSSSGICIVMDPPFGGRVEPLVQTWRDLSQAYTKVSRRSCSMLNMIWAFPYFSEPYIVNLVPEVRMHDYQVEYTNHTKFHSRSKGRKFGSPVRLFTNLPLDSFNLSNNTNYKLCSKCQYYVAVTNNHCNDCDGCTSKNGTTYKHCHICARCVKPTFFHCGTCKRCCLQKDHVCGVVVESQSCYNCNEKGHKRANCPQQEQKKPVKKHKT